MKLFTRSETPAEWTLAEVWRAFAERLKDDEEIKKPRVIYAKADERIKS